MINVSVSGIDGMAVQLGSVTSNIDNAILKLAERIHELSVEGADSHYKTGGLMRSLGHGAKKIKDGWLIKHDLQVAHYAPFVHWGTRPRITTPKNKKSLRRPARDGFVFSKRGYNKGYKGDPYMIRAAQTALAEFDSMIDKEFKNGAR